MLLLASLFGKTGIAQLLFYKMDTSCTVGENGWTHAYCNCAGCGIGYYFHPKSVDGKSNEIPAVQKLLEELEISGCLVVADTLNCQKQTDCAVIKRESELSAESKK